MQSCSESHGVLVTPADHLLVEGVDIPWDNIIRSLCKDSESLPPDLLLCMRHGTGESQKTAQGDQEPHHPAAIVRQRVKMHPEERSFYSTPAWAASHVGQRREESGSQAPGVCVHYQTEGAQYIVNVHILQPSSPDNKNFLESTWGERPLPGPTLPQD